MFVHICYMSYYAKCHHYHMYLGFVMASGIIFYPVFVIDRIMFPWFGFVALYNIKILAFRFRNLNLPFLAQNVRKPIFMPLCTTHSFRVSFSIKRWHCICHLHGQRWRQGKCFDCALVRRDFGGRICEVVLDERKHPACTYIKWCMYSIGEVPMRSREGYFGVYFPSCAATKEINTKITLKWACKQFATRVHTLFCFLHDIRNP